MDNDCNGSIDDADETEAPTWYVDATAMVLVLWIIPKWLSDENAWPRGQAIHQ